MPQQDYNDDGKTPSDTAHPWDVAVVFDSLVMEACGHSIAWNRFQDIPKQCPLCQASIAVICDPLVVKNNQQEKNTNHNTIMFKYNKQVFKLSLENPKRTTWWDRSECTAQARMAYALGMNAKNGIKVLYKGKVLYPNPTCSFDQVSRQLMDISSTSQTSSSNHHYKPSYLTVMGTRQGQGLHEPRQALWSIVVGMAVAIVWRVFEMGYGTMRYLYSFLIKPLPPPDDERRRDE